MTVRQLMLQLGMVDPDCVVHIDGPDGPDVCRGIRRTHSAGKTVRMVLTCDATLLAKVDDKGYAG